MWTFLIAPDCAGLRLLAPDYVVVCRTTSSCAAPRHRVIARIDKVIVVHGRICLVPNDLGFEDPSPSLLNVMGNDEATNTSPQRLLAAEKDVAARLRGRPLDFISMDAISNIYRAAAAVRRRAEGEVLAEYNLSFGGFTILWVLWVWGEMETAELADECGLAKGTLTGMLNTLEKRELVERHRMPADRRRMLVALTDDGAELIDEVFPKFNAFEAQMSDGLTKKQKQELAAMLRAVITNAN